MIHLQAAAGLLALLIFSACTSQGRLDGVETDSAARPLNLPELAQEPIPPAVALTEDYFQQSYAHLNAEQWQLKWRLSQKSNLLFIRSYVNVWFDELARLSSVGPLGPCFGDPHPENFGYLAFERETFVYTYNDVDDSGACPVAFDALRYFTTLKLYLHDSGLEAELRRAYVHFLDGEILQDRASRVVLPDPAMALATLLKKSTKKNRIKLDDTTLALSRDRAKALLSALQAAEPDCASCELLDAVSVKVSSGGSAGMDRYWLLVQTAKGAQQLLEFKELTNPGSQRGKWSQSLRFERAAIMKELWADQWPEFYAFASFEGKNFLIRSRLKADLELDELGPDQKKAVLMEQVYIMAQLHKKTLPGSGLLEEWLGRQSEFEAKRYAEALLAAKGG